MQIPLVSIVIVNYNVGELLLKCLYTIYNVNLYSPLEVIVVDNASKPGSLEKIESSYPVILIKNTKNIGFAAANNQGIKLATGTYIFMLNPDTEVKEDTINKLYQYVMNNNQAVITGPRQLSPDGNIQSSYWKFTNLFKSFLAVFFINIKSNFHSENNPLPVDALSGAGLFFKKDDFNHINGLDENLFWYEDEDLCYRMQVLTGKKCFYLPSAEIIHHVSKSARQDYRVPIANQLISRIKYYKKNHRLLQYYTIIIITVLHIITHLLVFFILSIVSQDALKKQRAYIFTIKKLFDYLSGKTKGVILP